MSSSSLFSSRRSRASGNPGRSTLIDSRQVPTCVVGNPADIASRHPSRKAFTLIELLIVIAIIAILSIVVVLTVNPAELLRQSRDSTRTSDMSTLQSALNLYVTDTSVSGSLQLGLINTLYTSLPDASSTCGSWGLPALPTGWSYHCANATSSKNIDANGWIPVNLKTMSLGSSLGSLPIDPINSSSTGLYYTYQTDGQKYEVTSIFESSKYKAQYAQNPQVPGYPEVLAEGSNLSLSPLWNPSGLVGYWPLDEGSGSTSGVSQTTDQSGNGNNGTWYGSASGTSGYYSAGKVGNWAGTFTGSNDYINLNNPSTMDIGTGAFSATAWVYTTSAGAPSTFMGWMSKGGYPSGLELRFAVGANSVHSTGGFIGSSAVEQAYNWQSNQWYHLAFTRDNSGNWSYYVNGISFNAGSNVQSVGTSTWNIGRMRGAPDYQWQGLIDDVRIYNRALSASEVQALYNAEK